MGGLAGYEGNSGFEEVCPNERANCVDCCTVWPRPDGGWELYSPQTRADQTTFSTKEMSDGVSVCLLRELPDMEMARQDAKVTILGNKAERQTN